MTMLPRQFVFLTIVTFVAALLIVSPAFTSAPGSEEEFDSLMALLTESLNLSPQQAETIRPRLWNQLEEMRELFASYRYAGAASLPSLMQEFEEKRESFRVDMDALLNDDQMKEFMKLRAEVDASIRETVVNFRVENLREQLELSDDQLEAVRPIIADNFDERNLLMTHHVAQAGGGPRLKRNLGSEITTADEKMERRLQEVLTKAQMDRYHQFMEEQRQHLREKEAVGR